MNKQKMAEQAKILRDKKISRISKVARELRPKVENGVVRYPVPQIQSYQMQSAPPAPPAPVRSARSVSPPAAPTAQQVEAKQQQVNPTQVVANAGRGCTGCRRKK